MVTLNHMDSIKEYAQGNPQILEQVNYVYTLINEVIFYPCYFFIIALFFHLSVFFPFQFKSTKIILIISFCRRKCVILVKFLSLSLYNLEFLFSLKFSQISMPINLTFFFSQRKKKWQNLSKLLNNEIIF